MIRPETMYLRKELIVIFLCIFYSCLAQCDAQETCISSVDASNRLVRFGPDGGATDVRVDRPLMKAALLSIVRIHLPCNQSQDLDEVRLSEGTGECDGNNGSIVTIVATQNRMFYLLGPLLYDVLTLGAMDVSERTNITDMLLPFAPCEDREDEVYRETVRLVRLTAVCTYTMYVVKCGW